METTQQTPVPQQENTYQLTAEDIARISAKKAMKADIKELVEQHIITKHARKTGTQIDGTDYTFAHIAASRYQQEREELCHYYAAYAIVRQKTYHHGKTLPNTDRLTKILAKYGR